MSGPISGQYGSVKIGSSCVAEANKWTLDKEATLHEFATCKSPAGGGMAVLPGRKKHSGSAEGLFDPDDPIENYLEEGDIVTLKLYVDATHYYQGSAVIEKLTIGDVDIQEGAPVPWSFSFKANGLFVFY